MKLTLSVVGVTLVASSLLPAQSDANKGQLAGTVYDAKQAVVPSAKVTIKSTRTGLVRQLSTNDEGQYRAVLLDPGSYEISVDSAGFATSKIEGVPLSVGATVRVDVVLQVQATVTSVEVGATLMNLASPAPSTFFSTQAIANLPINGRRFQDFAVLTPTVQVDLGRGQLSFAGQRGINANVMLDGADYNQPFFGGIRGGERSNSIITVPQGAIQEFQVVTTGYSAEYGRSTGGILNTITKSGSNEIHGEGFYLLRHKEMGLKDPVQLIASLETLHQFGGAVGGPVKRDQLFVFGAIERQDSRTPRQVQFPSLIGFTPTAATQEAFDFLRAEEKPFSQTNDAWAFTVRGDYQTKSGDRLTLRYNFSDASAENAVSVGGSLNPFTNRAFTNDGIEKDRTHTGTLQFTHLFSPTMLNDLRFTGTYELRPRTSNSALPQVALGSPAIATFGARNFLPTTQNDRRTQIADGLSMTRGTHTIKLGVDYNRIAAAQIFGFNQYGAFSVSGANVATLLDLMAPGGTIANRFDDPSVTYNRQLGNLTAELGMHQVAAFAQDSWRVNNQVTLDLGFRWEGQYNPQPETNNTNVLNLVKSIRYPNGASLDPTSIRNNTAQLMPRFGFAWTPFTASHRTVVRGHTGIFYASTPLITLANPSNALRLPPGDVSITLNNSGTVGSVYQQLLRAGVDLNRSPLTQLPVISIETVQQAATIAAGGTARDPFTGASLIVMPDDFNNPRSFQFGLGAESEVLKNLVIGAQFNYVNTVHLNRNRDYNVPSSTIRAGDLSLRPFYGLRSTGRRPLPTLAGITVRESSAHSMFRGLTLSAQRRTKMLQFGAHYTWSQNYSDDDGEREATTIYYEDPNNFRNDYGFSRSDLRHQFAGWFLVNLPLGFDVSGGVRTRSGLPINPVTGGDTNEDLQTNDRPYSAPGVVFARNSFRNREVIGNDLRVQKSFPIGSETRKIQFSAEFFNLMNLDNVVFSGTNGGLTGGVYGLGIGTNGQPVAIDSRFQRLRNADGSYDRQNAQSGNPLQVQFGLRFLF